MKHYVIPIVSKPLFKQPLDLLPEVWANYVKSNYVVIRMKKK